MIRPERVFNFLAGLSVLSWAVLGAVTAPSFSIVRLCLCLIHGSVGLLFLLRSPLQRGASANRIALAIPSLVCGGFLFRSSGSPWLWPLAAKALFVIGTAVALVSLAALGRSFAVLPALRNVVVHGPYAVVRHPIYAGEAMLALACAVAAGGGEGVALFALFLPLMALRILVEEWTLEESGDYEAYRARVAHRLVPGVW